MAAKNYSTQLGAVTSTYPPVDNHHAAVCDLFREDGNVTMETYLKQLVKPLFGSDHCVHFV